MKKAQLHTPTDLCLKFEMKTPSGYGETARTNLGQKNNVFHSKIPKMCVTWIKREKRTTTGTHHTNLCLKFKMKTQAVVEKQCGQDLGQKAMFFHPKIPKICVTWKKREKGTTTHLH